MTDRKQQVARFWVEHSRVILLVACILCAGITSILVLGLGNAEKDAESCQSRVANIELGNEDRADRRASYIDNGKAWMQAALARRISAEELEGPARASSIKAARQYARTARRDIVRGMTLKDLQPADCSTTADYWPFF